MQPANSPIAGMHTIIRDIPRKRKRPTHTCAVESRSEVK